VFSKIIDISVSGGSDVNTKWVHYLYDSCTTGLVWRIQGFCHPLVHSHGSCSTQWPVGGVHYLYTDCLIGAKHGWFEESKALVIQSTPMVPVQQNGLLVHWYLILSQQTSQNNGSQLHEKNTLCITFLVCKTSAMVCPKCWVSWVIWGGSRM
jgi:hypothetical protein